MKVTNLKQLDETRIDTCDLSRSYNLTVGKHWSPDPRRLSCRTRCLLEHSIRLCWMCTLIVDGRRAREQCWRSRQRLDKSGPGI